MRSTVSVVIPVYNGQDTVVHALRSVQHQTSPPAEVIVVDDGSFDETGRIVSDFLLDNRLAGWRLIQQSNNGPAGARNAGIRAAKGQHIALLDADDEWTPEKLARSMASVKAFGLDIIGAPLPRGSGARGNGCCLIDKRSMLFRNPYFTSTVVFSRDAYFQVGGFNLTQRYSEDYRLWLAFAWRGKRAGLMDDACAMYRPARNVSLGLSSRRWRMETGEIDNYLWLYRSGLINVSLFGAASTVSFAKFLRRLARLRTP